MALLLVVVGVISVRVRFFSMERRGGHCHGAKHPPPLPPPRRARGERRQASASSGSFSASLLDAIYRSLDEGDGGADVFDAAARGSVEEKAAATATATAQFWWAKDVAKPRHSSSSDRDRRRREAVAVARPRHSGYASSTTSSSDSSASYSSFSCSSASTTDTESAHRRHSGDPPPPRMSEESVVATDAEEATPPPKSKGKKKKSRPCFPVARIRPRASVPPSSGPQPPSPATFACALKALFSSARLQRKTKTPAAAPQPPASPPLLQPQRVSSTSTAKAADAPQPSEPRTVRFGPDAGASVVVRRRVEELVRSLEELEEDEEGSDASSDLFELESLRRAGADELPVYGTTSLVANRAIAQGAAC